MRKIKIIGDIDHEAYLDFTTSMDEFEAESEKPINVVICSDGGDAMVALAFYERIKMSPCEITTTATGLVASAAVLILAAGKHRRMTKSAWVMVHDDTPGPELKNLRVSAAQKVTDHFRRVEDQWNQLLEECTGIFACQWDDLHRNETYLDSSECLRLNLVQEVL